MPTKKHLLALFAASSLLAQRADLPGFNALRGAFIPGSYALTSFTAVSNALDISFSNDHQNFWGLNPAPLYPNHQRDASIGKVGNHYCVIHTGSGSGEQSNTVFYAQCTPDCVSPVDCASKLYNGWGPLATVSVSEVTGSSCGACQVWAPEFVRNADNSVYVDGSGFPYVSVTISVNTNVTFNLYTIHFTSLTLATKDNAVLSAVVGPATGLIDSFILNTGSAFEVWYQAWTAGGGVSCLQVNSSATLTGTYTAVHSGNWAGWGCSSQEGPALLFTGGTSWMLVADLSGGQLDAGQMYFATSTDSRATWTAFSPLNTPKQAKQGTLIPFP